MLLIDIRSTNASVAEFILYRLKLYLAGRHHHHQMVGLSINSSVCLSYVSTFLARWQAFCASLTTCRVHADHLGTIF